MQLNKMYVLACYFITQLAASAPAIAFQAKAIDTTQVELKQRAENDPTSRRAQLNYCLYDTLKGLPLELIKIIVAYDGNVLRGQLQQTLQEKGTITALAALENNKLLVGKSDGTVVIWNRTTGKREQYFKAHSYAVESIAVVSDHAFATSSSGRNEGCLAAFSFIHDVCINDTHSNEPVKLWNQNKNGQWDCLQQLVPGQDGIITRALRHLGGSALKKRGFPLIKILPKRQLVGLLIEEWKGIYFEDSTVSDNFTTIIVWDPQGKIAAQLKLGSKSNICSLESSVDGAEVYIGGNTIFKAFSTNDLKEIRSFALAPEEIITKIVPLSHNRILTYGSIENDEITFFLKLWNTATGTCTHTFNMGNKKSWKRATDSGFDFEGLFLGIAITMLPDDKIIIGPLVSGAMNMFDPHTHELENFTLPQSVNEGSFHMLGLPDGELATASADRIQIWN